MSAPDHCLTCGGVRHYGACLPSAHPSATTAHTAPTVDERSQAHEASLADLRARLERAEAEGEYLRAEWKVAMAEVAKLRAALRDLVSAVSARLTRGEDTVPGQFESAWRAACALLAETEGR